MRSVEDCLATLDGGARAMIERLRSLVLTCGPVLTESVKWNAPSYAVGDLDRITLGVERKGGVRLVLHRGVKASAEDGFVFDDVAKVARWPAPDRGVVTFDSLSAIEGRASDVQDLCARWVRQTT